MRHLSLFVLTFCFGKLQFHSSYFFMVFSMDWVVKKEIKTFFLSKLSSTLQFFIAKGAKKVYHAVENTYSVLTFWAKLNTGNFSIFGHLTTEKSALQSHSRGHSSFACTRDVKTTKISKMLSFLNIISK